MPLAPGHGPGTALLKLERTEPGIDRFILLVKPVTTVGRHPSNQICLPRNTVSRFHARIVRDGDLHFVEDLGSSNGTFVNDQKIKRQEVINGDRVTFGNLDFRFYLDEESPELSRESSDTKVELRHDDPQTPVNEVLHTVPAPDSDMALSNIGELESVAMASKYLGAHYALLDIIRQRPGLERLLESALELVMDTIQAERGVIMLREKQSDDLEPVTVLVHNPSLRDRHVTISQTIVDRCINERLSILSTDATTDSRFSESDSIFQQQVHSAICVPLTIRSRILGVCYLDRLQGLMVFRHSDLDFASNLCSQLAMAIDNLRMVRERIQAEQMAIIGRTMAEVSHSIKNILGVSRPAAELMGKYIQVGNIDGLTVTWKAISQSMERMHSLSNAMLDYSRTEEADRSEQDINRIARDAFETLKPEMEKAGIAIEFMPQEGLRTVWLDAEGLFDALVNLALNARDALRDQTAARIEIRTEDMGGGEVSVAVVDNGPGIPTDEREKVFLPFYSTKGAHGNGMGLAMVRKYTSQMGGRTDLESVPHERTVFRLIFPVIAMDEAPGGGGI